MPMHIAHREVAAGDVARILRKGCCMVFQGGGQARTLGRRADAIRTAPPNLLLTRFETAR